MDIKNFWRLYRKNKGAVVGLVLVVIVISMAILAPFLAPYNPKLLGKPLLPPGEEGHMFGTDELGRDIFSRILYGAQISLLVGLLAAAFSSGVGTFVGTISGFFGGKIDDLLMRFTDGVLVIPRFFFALLLVALFGPSIWNIIIAFGILSWPTTARLARAGVLSLKEREFVEAVKAQGGGRLRIMFSEILPNASPPIVVAATLEIAAAILLEASLSFLGLGDPNAISWGQMLMNAQRYLRVASWVAIFPGLSVFFTVLGFNLVGDGLNDVFNPRLKERK